MRHLSSFAASMAMTLAAGLVPAQTTSVPAERPGKKLVEIYRIAPGEHEAFLRAIARFDEVNRRAGLAPRELYIHRDGASWDFLLIQDAEYPEGAGEAVGRAWDEMRLPSGPRFFTEFREFILEHTDTFATGPTTAAAYLAELDATPVSAGFDGLAPPRYRLRRTVPLGGTPRWDYLKVDPGARRLYIAHDATVDVVDLDEQRVVGRVTGLAGAHGIALAPEIDRGFVANGDRDTVTAFGLTTLQTVAEAPVGSGPDSVTLEPVSGRVLAWNGDSRDVTILEAETLRPIATVALGGTPEFAVADGHGAVFVNIEESHEIVRVDAATAAVVARLDLPGCESPHGLAMDAAAGRLFSACGNAVLIAIDAGTGEVLGRARIGRGTDAAVFDPVESRVFVSSSEGFVSVVDIGPDGEPLTTVAVQTRVTGRTLALDPENRALFVPAADLDVDWGTRKAVFAPGGLKLYVYERASR